MMTDYDPAIMLWLRDLVAKRRRPTREIGDMEVTGEASNIVRRFIRVAEQLDPTELRLLQRALRTLKPEDMRQLASEVHEVEWAKNRTGIAHVHRVGDPPRPRPPSRVAELRGLARSVIRYGGPDAVLRDADPALVETLKRLAWPPP